MLTLEETMLGHYRLLRRLCRGGMSEVYLAHDEEEDRDVAIKVVNDHYVDHTERLQRELKAVRTLTHEHILPILDYGEEGSWHYLVMPYLEQGTLRERLAKGSLSLEEAGRILEQIASALQFAHDHGFLHRDIKPSNILLGEEQQVYLGDFGLAKLIGQPEKNITQTGCLIGTPEYMAPELVEEPFSESCDVYALGVLVYQMVTGQVPFKGSTPLSVYWKHIQEQPLPPSLLNPAITFPVEQVILRALEKEPCHRFKSAQALAQAYMQALHFVPGGPVMLRVLPLEKRRHCVPPKLVHRNIPRMIALVILLLFLFTSSLSLGLFVSKSWAHVEASQLLGTSAQGQSASNKQQKDPTPILGTPPRGVKGASGLQLLAAQVQGQTKKHKHGHKHKHDQQAPRINSSSVELDQI